MQLYEALILPPTNHFQNGGSLVSSVLSQVPVPGQQVSVFPEAFRVILLAEAFDDVGIAQIRLADKF